MHYLQDIIINKLNFQKKKKKELFGGKSLFLVMSPFPTLHSIYLNIGFWQGSFVWKCYAFICSTLNQKAILQFLKKSFSFQKTCFKVKVLKKFKIPSVYLIKTCQSLKWRAIFKISSTVFWRCSRSFYWFKNKTSSKKLFLV